VAAEPGMGKSTILAYLTNQERKAHPTKADHALWILRVNLKEYQKQIRESRSFNEIHSVINFLSLVDSKGLETFLARGLLQYKLQHQGKIALLLDGFDEIKQDYQEKIIRLIKFLKDSTKAERIWVTTRLQWRDMLEDRLSVFSYSLKPFDDIDQTNFLKKFWEKYLEKDLSTGQKINDQRLNTYVKALLERFAHSTRDEERSFMGIPLQVRMLAEAFQRYVKEFHKDDNATLNLPDKLDLLNLYQRFIQEKYHIYCEAKLSMVVDVNSDFIKETLAARLTKAHQRFTFRNLFPEEEKGFFTNQAHEEDVIEKSKEALIRVGIIQLKEDKLDFLHRTFAEYFVADLLANRLNKKVGNPTKYQLADTFLQKQLFESKNNVIRHFLDRKLANGIHVAVLNNDEEEVRAFLSKHPEDVKKVDKLGRKPVHLAASYRHKRIVELLNQYER
jgi:predicted NACHT family NTPase